MSLSSYPKKQKRFHESSKLSCWRRDSLMLWCFLPINIYLGVNACHYKWYNNDGSCLLIIATSNFGKKKILHKIWTCCAPFLTDGASSIQWWYRTWIRRLYTRRSSSFNGLRTTRWWILYLISGSIQVWPAIFCAPAAKTMMMAPGPYFCWQDIWMGAADCS